MPTPRRVRRNLLSRINPFLKMGIGFGLVILSLFLKNIAPMLVLVGGVLLLMTQLKLRPLFLGYGLLMVAVFTGSTALLLGNWPEAILSTLRLLAIVLPTPILALTTPPADLIRSLQTVRLPSFLTLSLMLIWRFFPLMQQELQRIWEANQLRGIDLRWRPGQWFSGLMVPLVFQMVVYADEVTIGLQTRGYSPTEPRSNSKPLRWQWADTLFCGVAIAYLSLITYLEWGR
ncbi:Energy-coupling factor transporter transmembrane protein EcfT [Acaryochloris thomasi RCC1774]|uniref:Energy-coupling factor transporter transmembrane protein EcfT n=1 Tax=Acaryochloris thomasi RCC1774 TaxID=1764569 RepID=A0A2W1JFP0_9CYAN|nr:energy-coupling factor transporter transmembrane component T [Acaryochloris thomasi]PZD70495.1 Energy-coupling factor transporter transmembrane protein EcfT [Acaryochloris thomasi RCC1774]